MSAITVQRRAADLAVDDTVVIDDLLAYVAEVEHHEPNQVRLVFRQTSYRHEVWLKGSDLVEVRLWTERSVTKTQSRSTGCFS